MQRCVVECTASSKEGHMSRFVPALVLAVGCAAMTAAAQETTVKSTVKSTGGKVKTVTYTGCWQGDEIKPYSLNRVVPMSRTTTTETTGPAGETTTTTTTYMLVPGENVDIRQHLGHKVEVTGMLIPAGRVTSETKTTIEREHGKDIK